MTGTRTTLHAVEEPSMPRRTPIPQSASSKHPNTQHSQIQPNFQHLTISDDQSKGSDLDARKLIALKSAESTLDTQDNPDHSGDSDDSAWDRIEYASPSQRSQIHYTVSRKNINGPARAISHVARPGQPAREMSARRQMRTNHSFSGTITEPSGDTDDALTGEDNRKPAVELPEHDMTLEELRLHIGNLQKKARELESSHDLNNTEHYRILYRIRNFDNRRRDIYLDHPQWSEAGRTIQSRQALQNFDLFLERNKSISFIVFREFDQDQKPHDREVLIEPEHLRESIYVVSKELDRAMQDLLSSLPEYVSLLHKYDQVPEIQAPYLLLYHTRDIFKQLIRRFPASTRQHITHMTDYISKQLGHEYLKADALLDQGKISKHFLKYLFKPGDILVHTKDKNGHQGCIAESWPDANSTSDNQALNTRSEPEDYGSMESDIYEYHSPLHGLQPFTDHQQELKDTDGNTSDTPSLWAGHLRTRGTSENPYRDVIETWSWGFYGSFVRQRTNFSLELPPTNHSGHRDDVFNIIDLDIYPLKYAPSTVRERLQRRGEMFWQCRRRSLVSYREENGDLDQPFWERYMIDFSTFRSLHPSNEDTLAKPTRSADGISGIQMESAEPPDEQFKYVVPNQIKGLNLRTKKWHDLNVDWMHPVIWNENIFETLVLDRKTKELIQALVSKQITAQKSTDVVTGKGNGLIMLLHGGPGTGKTLTAEGVAEIAKKPLYRVTCGDVGTKAEDVEKYLESVLHLGKIWDCVVLLDEAEVFLEQRTLDNLQRNALVSVFLRVLEYHDGILILTSNRVGTFDEAFRSRIQIAIHYPALGVSRRRKIWNNFIDRLESFRDDTVDVEDLRGHIEDLQKFEMNGRQIRNAITTARQYAEWKGEKMDYEYLKDVVDVATKFDAYSTKLKGGYTDDQLAEEEGVR